MAHRRPPIPTVPLALLVLISAAGRLAAGSSLSNAGDIAAIVAAAVAVLLLLWSIGRWLLRKAREKRAARPPRKVFGELDYQPEYIRATEEYLAAQQQITDAVMSFSQALTKYQPIATQEQANEAGAAARALCDAFDEQLSVMREKGEIARECLRGVLGRSAIATDGDADAGVTMQGMIRNGRIATVGYSRSMKGAKSGIASLRKKNISLSLNEPVDEIARHLRSGRRIARRVGLGMRTAEWHLTRRLLWYRVRKRLRLVA